MWALRRESVAVVLAYIPGGDLFTHLQSHGCMSEAETQHCLRHVLRGLQWMHSHSIMHRDCKLENILIDGDPSQGVMTCTMRITDFNLSAMLRPRMTRNSSGSSSDAGPSSAAGASSAVDGADDVPVCAQPREVNAPPAPLFRVPTPVSVLETPAGLERLPPPALHSHVGSVPYAAPEIWAATADGPGYGLKVDIYAAGVCAYASLTDAFPFADRSDVSLRKQMVSGPHIVQFHEQRRLQHGCPPLSPMAQRFLALMLTADPTRRPNAEAALAHPWLRVDDAGGAAVRPGASLSRWGSLPFSISDGELNTPSPAREALPRRWSILTCGTADPETESTNSAALSKTSSLEPLSPGAHDVPADQRDQPVAPLAHAAEAGAGGQQEAHAPGAGPSQHRDATRIGPMAWTAVIGAIMCCGRLDD
jgi:serine/threonine protein kinase